MKYFLNISILRRNPNFALLFWGQSISFIGTMITSVALPYQIYHQTQSTLMVGLLSLAQLIPLLFTALIGGVLADRHHRIKLLLTTEFFLAICCLLLALNAYLQNPHIWALFVISSIASAFTGLHRPAMDSIRQQIVDKADYPAAGALIMSILSLNMIIGPAVGGLIISHYGLVATYIIDFFSFVVSFACIFMMRNVPNPKRNRDESTLTSLKSGLKYAFSRQELMGTYYVDFIAMIFGMPNALFPAIAQSFGGVKTLGLLYSAPALGALVISLLSGWIKYIKRQGAAIAIAAAFWGIAIIFFGLSSNLWLALLFLAFAGAFDAISGIFRGIMWNETIPNELRGRLSGIEMISYLSGPKLGDTEAGLIAAAFGVTFSVISGGILCVAGVLGCCYFMPKFWRYHSDKSQ
jgi:MFS family permease